MLLLDRRGAFFFSSPRKGRAGVARVGSVKLPLELPDPRTPAQEGWLVKLLLVGRGASLDLFNVSLLKAWAALGPLIQKGLLPPSRG